MDDSLSDAMAKDIMFSIDRDIIQDFNIAATEDKRVEMMLATAAQDDLIALTTTIATTENPWEIAYKQALTGTATSLFGFSTGTATHCAPKYSAFGIMPGSIYDKVLGIYNSTRMDIRSHYIAKREIFPENFNFLDNLKK